MRTVFILGAGASIPYGLPSGYDLVGAVLRTLQTRKHDFYPWGFDEQQVAGFVGAIQDSVPSAIDDLIVERHGEFAEIGKLAIAYSLSQYERPEVLRSRENPDNWYGHLFKFLVDYPGVIPAEMFSFVTFNYDRSLEQYLAQAVAGHFGGGNPEKAASILRTPILHVHGHLGKLPAFGGDLPYTPIEDRSTIKKMSLHLRLTEEEGETGAVAAAQVLIQKATRIRFLGFGYHASNMEKLSFKENAAQCRDIAGTGVGISTQDRQRLSTQYGIELGAPNETNLAFLRDSRPLSA